MADVDQRPTPDPTELTTEQLLREVENAVKLVQAQLEGLQGVFTERFASVDKQFVLIERQRIEQKTDTATAVQAALSAAKEAVTEQTSASEKSIKKTEDSTADQLRQLTQTFTTAIGGVTDSIGDLKDRVGNIEARKEGNVERQVEYRATSSDQRANAVAIVAFLGVIATIIAYAIPH